MPRTIPDAVKFASKSMTSEQLVDQIIYLNQTIDSWYDLARLFLYCWITVSVINVIFVGYVLIKNRRLLNQK